MYAFLPFWITKSSLSRTLPNFRNVISPNQSNIVKKLLTSNISSVNLVGGMLRKSWHQQMYLSWGQWKLSWAIDILFAYVSAWAFHLVWSAIQKDIAALFLNYRNPCFPRDGIYQLIALAVLDENVLVPIYFPPSWKDNIDLDILVIRRSWVTNDWILCELSL